MSIETVSIIITVHNGEKFIEKCFNSIKQQTVIENCNVRVEISIYNDASSDGIKKLLQDWKYTFDLIGVSLLVQHGSGKPRGVGYGRNRAIEMSTGDYLCFQDIDDEMIDERIEKQYSIASYNKRAIVGTKFVRLPAESTCRFTKWANELNADQLMRQIYTANGPTVIMPTWFCHRNVYNNIPGGFSEAGTGTPEDLIFFYEHINRGGQILRCDQSLLRYRFHPEATTFSIAAKTIWKIRLEHLLKYVLQYDTWKEGFTIWNAGKQGRRFYRDLPKDIKLKVLAFCDVDKNKINKVYQYYDAERRKMTYTVPIVHFSIAQKPLLICMKLNLTKGVFESNLQSLNLCEGKDYVLFS